MTYVAQPCGTTREPAWKMAYYEDCFLVMGVVFLLALLPARLTRSTAPRERSLPAPATPPGALPTAAPLVVQATQERPDCQTTMTV